MKEQRLLKARGKQRTDSTLVLAAIRALNRLECVGETMRHALNVLAVTAPEWLMMVHQPAWADRYGPRIDDYRLPEGKQDRIAYAEAIGTDDQCLLTALDAPDTPDWLRQLLAVVTLRQVWEQNYHHIDEQLRWRSSKEIPPSSEYINSPYDPEARYSQKRSKTWVGYKVHVTETCEPDSPHLITHVETTNATLADDEVLMPTHDDLEAKALLPAIHLVDAGYVTVLRLVESQEQYHVDLYGPARSNYHWQAREATGFAV